MKLTMMVMLSLLQEGLQKEFVLGFLGFRFL